MAPRDAYGPQFALLLRCLPAIGRVREFALKGGTAINLFLRDMPRLSVDIDLTYLPVTGRESALAAIRSGLETVAEEHRRTIPGVKTQLVGRDPPKLLVGASNARIKVEPNAILRGSLLPPVERELCPAAQEAYELTIVTQCLHAADLYGGKLCAALDRQHPRDLFDIMLLQQDAPIPDVTRQAFVAYVAAHRRPIAELLAPKRKPIEGLFTNQFDGMTSRPVKLAELEAARTRLFDWAGTALTESERRFLLSIKRGEPEWDLLPFAGLENWPATQWKLHNIRKMDMRRHKEALARLQDILDY